MQEHSAVGEPSKEDMRCVEPFTGDDVEPTADAKWKLRDVKENCVAEQEEREN